MSDSPGERNALTCNFDSQWYQSGLSRVRRSRLTEYDLKIADSSSARSFIQVGQPKPRPVSFLRIPFGTFRELRPPQWSCFSSADGILGTEKETYRFPYHVPNFLCTDLHSAHSFATFGLPPKSLKRLALADGPFQSPDQFTTHYPWRNGLEVGAKVNCRCCGRKPYIGRVERGPKAGGQFRVFCLAPRLCKPRPVPPLPWPALQVCPTAAAKSINQ
jgi:hypothetical protein